MFPLVLRRRHGTLLLALVFAAAAACSSSTPTKPAGGGEAVHDEYPCGTKVGPASAPTSQPATPPAAPAAKQGESCVEATCAEGLDCVRYFGIAGASGPKLGSCEIRCGEGDTCPDGQQCVTIMDGPGKVCRAPPPKDNPFKR